MSVVIPFMDCIARPNLKDQRFPLPEHLQAVAAACGRADGAPEERLAFLAGLMHDAAKGALEWQRNINPPRPGRPPHAPLGAALFAFWADDLIPTWVGDDKASKKALLDAALDWARVVYDHHGALDDLGPEPPWFRGAGGIGIRGLLSTLDQAGLTVFVRRVFSTARDLSSFSNWLDDFDDVWQRRQRSDRPALLRQARQNRPDEVPLAPEGLRLASFSARLVFADRSHVADWTPEAFSSAEAAAAVEALEETLRKRAKEALEKKLAHPDLVSARERLNAAALDGYRLNPNLSLFTLLLPTGFGKTLSGLRVALEACRLGRRRRIIYVAPYLSILSQAAKEIAGAAKVEVFVHDHMSAATLEDHQPYDILDTWQAPVLATTFNQFFRALFPTSAQQCLRRPALEEAFLLIDEPQIIDKETWNVFLRSLSVICREQRCQALLLTATLPPTEVGFGCSPVDLVKRVDISVLSSDRYVIHRASETWNVEKTAEETLARFGNGKSVAVILNTIRDACDVYLKVIQNGNMGWRFLAATMLPGHKAKVIAELRRMLRPPKEGQLRPPVGVVCTQVLEAGIDLSFQSLLRALPVFPSLIQAAGRANRHGIAHVVAEVVTFDYRRQKDKESRKFIYKSVNARKMTDEVLSVSTPLGERGVPEALDQYFRDLWEVEPATAPLERFEKSARGEWSQLAGLSPFAGDDSWRVDVFVPYPNGEVFLPYRMARLMDRFAPDGPLQLLTHYRDPTFRKSLEFRDRKRVSALLHQYCVAVPKRTAEKIATQIPEHDWLWVMDDPSRYSKETGLAHLLIQEDSEQSDIII